MEICREAAQLGDSFPRQTVLQIREWCGRSITSWLSPFCAKSIPPFQASYHVFEVTATANRAVKIG